MSKLLVSVVIPTFNSAQFLKICLHSIKKQTYPNIEIIVVDKYSTDKTKDIAEKYANVVLFKGLRAEARNVGAALAKGDFILSIDSDMELAPEVIAECITKAEGGLDALIIPELSIGLGFWANCKALEKACYVGDNLIEASRFFKKKVFDGIGGYDGLLVFGEDWDLHERIVSRRFRVGRSNAFICHHEGALSLRGFILKKRQYGKTLGLYRAKHPEKTKQQLNIIRPAFVRNWRKLAKDPAHAIGMLFMKACELGATWLGSSN